MQAKTLRVQQKLVRQKAILDAASVLFAENGYEAATVEMVAERALVSAPTVYNYFGSKALLLLALIYRGDQETGAILAKSIESPRLSAEDEISNLLILMVKGSLEAVDYKTWRQAYAMTITSANTEVGDGYTHLNATLYDTIERLIVSLIGQEKLNSKIDIKYVRGMLERLNHSLFGDVIAESGMPVKTYEKTIRSYVRTVLCPYR